MMAEGEAKKIRMIGESEADRAARVGVAQALALEEQVRAYGGPQFQLVQQVMSRFAEAIETSHADVVPKIQMTTGGDGKGGGSLVENLLALLLSGKLSDMTGALSTLEPADPRPRPCAPSCAAACRGPRRAIRGTGRRRRVPSGTPGHECPGVGASGTAVA